MIMIMIMTRKICKITFKKKRKKIIYIYTNKNKKNE